MYKQLIGFSTYDAVKRCDEFNVLARNHNYDAAYMYAEADYQ